MKTLKTIIFAAAFSVLGGYFSAAEAVDTVTPQETIIGPFGGLNTQDNPAIIGADQAQDLLNVDITPQGKSVKKRQGFAIDTTFTYSTSAVHGLYKFFDTNGNEVRLAGQDLGLYASVSGGSWVRVATGTLAATWQCTDYLGSAYCVTSARDTPVKTDGTTAGTSYTAIPAGTLIMSTPDRLVVGNTAANPSRLSYSGSVNFTDFTVGSQVTSSSYEDIAAPGSHLTHLAYHYGRWLWWKDQSFGFIQGTDQTNLQLVTVSDTIGTYDNTDVFWQGITYFRGNDNQIYTYDGAVLTPISRDITPTVNSANRRKASLWTQTSLADWNTGSIVPSLRLSTAIVSGDITLSSYSATDTSRADFLLGTASSMTYESSDLIISTNATTMSNYSFETGDETGWNDPGNSGNVVTSFTGIGGGCNIASAQDGTYFLAYGGAFGATPTYYISIWDANTNVGISTTTIAWAQSCTWTSRSLTVGSTYARRKLKIVISDNDGFSQPFYSDPWIANGANITFYTAASASCSLGSCKDMFFDNFSATYVSNISTATFVSQIFDTGFTSSTCQIQGGYTANNFSPTFSLQSSTATGGKFLDVTTSSTTSGVANRYLKYTSTFTVGTYENALTTLNDATVVCKTTGTFYSAVNNAPNITAWNNLGVSDSLVGGGLITYYVRASTGSFTVLSSTPLWVAQTKNATVNYSTGTYMQLRADFSVTSATDNATLSDFTFNWFEGNAADKMYGTYYDYAIWFSVSLGSTTSNNNRILRYDLINQLWTVYDIPSNGFLMYNNYLYFGSPSVGKIYKFGNNTTADDTASIQAYWKSKDFFAASPFLDEDMRTLSWYVKNSSNTLTVTYTTNGTSSTSYSFSTSSTDKSFLRHNRNFLAGTLANNINFKFGDTSSLDLWEVFAGQYTYVPKPWNAN